MAANPTAVRRSAGQGTPAQTPARRPAKPLHKRLYDKYGTALGTVLTISAIVIGFVGRDSRRLFAEHGLGYALGIIGSLLLLTLLMYPLRKRFKFLKVIGPVKNWFRVHMMLGIVGPLAILYHSNFQLGSVNSTAALLAMLLVAGSGIVGRFLYAKVHKGLYGRKTSLKELLASVKLTTAETGGAAQFIPDLLETVAEYDRQVLQPPKGILDCMVLPIRLEFKTRTGYRSIMGQVSDQLDIQAFHSPVVRQHRDRLLELTRRFVKEHLKRVRRVAAFAAYDRLFSLWHKVHLPFFFLLIVTAIVHVIAVHMYSI